jgi:hypothetical protein
MKILTYSAITLFKEIRLDKMVGETGFEPATPWTQTKCATKLRYSPTKI